jgi:peptide chain release factor 2
LFDLAYTDQQLDIMQEILNSINTVESKISELEFNRLFNQPYDSSNCFVDIQSGSGGVEAQDWAEMLLRMYIRYSEKKSFQVDILESQNGDVAGIKSATIKVSGEYAFGLLRTETGVHRLVRNSPFDANNKRHTSFASVFVYPEIDDDISIEINPADLRIDTYRSSGAGGQHVNTTDSAVRIIHLPTNTVVQCQNDRSQHRNRDEAMKMLKAKLYELEIKKKNAEKNKLEQTKTDIGWGYQIRSYVFDQSRIKDLRTGIEIGNLKAVMDGDLDHFINASLKHGV